MTISFEKFCILKRRHGGFTLVELIIVITILAILSVSAFLVISQWIGKSRDSRRLSDLGTIQRALEVSLTENAKYPTPDSAVNITAGSIIIGQQGKFGDSARSATDIKTTPMDPLDNVAYTYYVATGGKNYQVMGFLENSSTLTFRGIESQGPRSTVSDQENLQFSNSACTCNSNGTNSICSVASLAFCLNYAHASEVSAADYSVRIPTVKGETLGILILSGTNQPVEELGSTIDMLNGSTVYKAIFSDSITIVATGAKLVNQVFLNKTQDWGYLNSSLLGSYDMQTAISTGGITYLKDFGPNARHLQLSGGLMVGGTQGIVGSATFFDGINDYVFGSLLATTGDVTISSRVKTKATCGGGPRVFYFNLNVLLNNCNQVVIDNSGGLSVNIVSSKIINDDARHQVVATRSGTVFSLYVDGVLGSWTGGTAGQSYGSLYIGSLQTTPGYFFSGAIDEFKVFGYAMDAEEIKNMYKNKQ